MLSTLLNTPITIVNRTDGDSDDGYGNLIPAETIVETVGELQQQRRTEPGGHDDLSDTTWLLVLPAGTVLDAGDQVIAAGHTYEVIGEPWEARNPRTQTLSHVEATLRRTAGSEDGS